MNAAFASPIAERGGGRGFKSRPVHFMVTFSEKKAVFNNEVLLDYKYDG
jgi:hypothetical protein